MCPKGTLHLRSKKPMLILSTGFLFILIFLRAVKGKAHEQRILRRVRIIVLPDSAKDKACLFVKAYGGQVAVAAHFDGGGAQNNAECGKEAKNHRFR